MALDTWLRMLSMYGLAVHVVVVVAVVVVVVDVLLKMMVSERPCSHCALSLCQIPATTAKTEIRITVTTTLK